MVSTEISESGSPYEYMLVLYLNFTPKLDKGTVKIVNEEGFSELQFDLPNQKPLEMEPSVVKMMIFLIVGVLIGIIVTICLVFMNQRYCNRHPGHQKVKENASEIEMYDIPAVKVSNGKTNYGVEGG